MSDAKPSRGGRRPGAGRPPDGPEALTVRRMVRVSPTMDAAIAAAAEAGGQEDSEWLRDAIESALERSVT